VIDADTKLVPTFKVGDRSRKTAQEFVRDVASRMAYRVQISTDGLGDYVSAIESSFGADADYGQIIKTFGHEVKAENRYSQPEVIRGGREGCFWRAQSGVDFYQLRGAPECHDSAAHAPHDAAHAGLLEEAGGL
jgi:hypothetical protein